VGRGEAMVRMGKSRNAIVHHEARVDPTIVMGILREHLEDVAPFNAAVLSWIEDPLTAPRADGIHRAQADKGYVASWPHR